MLASMSNMLRLKHERMETAIEIMDSLQNIFGKQSEQSRHEATRKYMNTKMSKGTPVRDHVLNKSNYINEVELYGAIIDERTQVSIILDSLTPNFLQFTRNYVMNKLDYNVTQLLNELQTFEAISKTRTQQAEANVAETKASSSYNNKKKRKNNKGASTGRPKNKQAAPKASDKKKGSKEKKPKGKCFHYEVDGHWKRNCNKYLSELKEKKKGKFDLLVLEANLVEVDSQSWIIDSGSTNHICSSLQMLSSSRELVDGECSMVVGNGADLSAVVVGAVRLELGNKFLVLNNVYCIPGFRRNFISVSKLYEQLFTVSFYNNQIFISRNGLNICHANNENGLYILRRNKRTLLNTELFRVEHPKPKKQKILDNDDTYLWHLRLGHISLDRINRLVKDGPLKELKVGNLPVCESCLEGKMTKRSFSAKGFRAKEPLELVHSDVCGPLNVQARGGYDYSMYLGSKS